MHPYLCLYGVMASLHWIQNPIAMQGDTMDATLQERIKEQLVRHEGLRLKPYRCPAGKLTIGVGRNLDDNGISTSEAYELLSNDICNCEEQLLDEIPEIYNALDEVRKSVLLNMCFNLGIKGLLEFKNTLAFIGAGDWERAANGMLASRWAKQVGRRAIELSELMRKGH
jgi:lysozyme